MDLDVTAGPSCDVCRGESGGEYAGVASVPGAPVSGVWCVSCVNADAVPVWLANVEVDLAGAAIPEGGVDITCFEPWWLDQTTWFAGRYLSLRDYYTTHGVVISMLVHALEADRTA